MSKDAIQSEAFHRATLKSESYRVTGFLLLLVVLTLFVIARGVTSGQHLLLVFQVLFLLFVIAHEVFILRAVRRALHEEKDVRPEAWVLNVLLESQIPTVALLIILLSGSGFDGVQLLFAPATLVYFLLIILSTLRLKPMLTLLTGLLSAGGYLLVTFYALLRFQSSGVQTGPFSLNLSLIFAAAIVIAGILAAIVSNQIRTYVKAALREAKLQSELQQINHDLDIARSIQQGLLPSRSPELDDFEIAGWNQPADQTGGDYFDWQKLPDGRLAISLADATGHGIGPALVSSLCRAYARASFLADDAQDQFLERLNSLLADDLSTNRFVTFAVMFLDPQTSEVKVLSAGHGPILWYQRASNELKKLDAQGIPLGMIAGMKYEDSGVQHLDKGDMIVIVTDGFYEWENPQGEEFGISRLEQTIQRAHDCSADEVIEKLRAAVKDFTKGTRQKDDLTAVVLKRKSTRWVSGAFDRIAKHHQSDQIEVGT